MPIYRKIEGMSYDSYRTFIRRFIRNNPQIIRWGTRDLGILKTELEKWHNGEMSPKLEIELNKLKPQIKLPIEIINQEAFGLKLLIAEIEKEYRKRPNERLDEIVERYIQIGDLAFDEFEIDLGEFFDVVNEVERRAYPKIKQLILREV